MRLIEELGRGGMGIVWLAEARGPGGFAKRVVVKELRPELAKDPAYRAMFLEEARLAARLRHANIVQTYEVGQDGDRWLMVLELLEGASLHRALALLDGGALPLAARVRVVGCVLSALHHAHELRDDGGAPLGVVHRDVTPHNVFLTTDGQVKLLDFGVAKARGRAQETKHGVLKGNVAYMSPDHVLGASIDRRADVFGAGVMLREVLTGERLWGDASDVEVLKRLLSRDVPPFPAGAGVPDELRAICERAMSPTRGDRYGTAEEMREALELWLEREAPRATSLVDVGRRLERALADAKTRASTELVELPSSALVTDVVPEPSGRTRGPRARSTGGGWARSVGMAMVGALGVLASVGSVFALAHDALVVRAAEGVMVSGPPAAPAPPPAALAAPEPPPPPAPEEPVAATADAALSAPDLPPNPYAEAPDDPL